MAAAPTFAPREYWPAFEETLGFGEADLEKWFDYRRKYNEKAAGLWRIGDKLYDLTKFVDQHPGGPEWLQMTRGTDITEAFEAHHPGIEAVRKIAEKYYVRDADWPRESPVTFEPDGFYAVLRERVNKRVKEIGPWPARLSKAIADTTAASFVGLCLAAAYKRSLPLALAAGINGGILGVMAHNWVHQKRQFRWLYMELSGGSHDALRMHHTYSHHLYPNTSLDVELPLFEAITGLNWWPAGPKSSRSLFINYLKYHLRLIFLGLLGSATAPLQVLAGKAKKKDTISYVLLLAMLLARRRSPVPNSKSLRGMLETYGLWAVARSFGAWWGLNVGLLAGHYGDEAWRQGDLAPPVKKIRDFGLLQLEATSDRVELYAPNHDLMLPFILSTFGDHSMHHLFPTVDHAYHRHLYGDLAEVCNRFGIRFAFTSTWDEIVMFWRQISRIDPLKSSRRVEWDGTNSRGWVDGKMGFKVGAEPKA
ncbi:hypothetical protein DFJ74DRAFT_676117 [Hyaloraphidium curvatum]|nr:hypothetical protein DFJ74DRAFT_676117 [Hyaloraphidium curvatum]